MFAAPMKNNYFGSPSIEHFENRIIMLFELFGNEIGPGVLQSTIQKNMCTARKPRAQGVSH